MPTKVQTAVVVKSISPGIGKSGTGGGGGATAGTSIGLLLALTKAA